MPLRPKLSAVLFVFACAVPVTRLFGSELTLVTDYTNYNAGSEVRVRMGSRASGSASIRYAGEDQPIGKLIPLAGSQYQALWTIPWSARTGRYEIDVTESGRVHRNAASFAVHRQLAKVISLDLDKTFYTAGDGVSPRIVVRNISNQPLDHLRVEFESYTYPWIAPAADEAPAWKTVVADSLSLAAGSEREFRPMGAAVVQADQEPVVIYYAVVIRDSLHADRIYDLAFAPPAFTIPPNRPLPKAYPFLYLYPHLSDLPRSSAYRQFYPAHFVSDVIRFDTAHTMFGTGGPAAFSFAVNPPAESGKGGSVQAQVWDANGKVLEKLKVSGALTGPHEILVQPLPPGLYTLRVAMQTADGTEVASNRLEFAVNALPASILIFCAHQDDDTAHPGLIRAAVENHIPIHVVYFTSGDAGGCDRFYMHSCDAQRAMDFGEVRMEEARASLGHLGVPRENISFLGLPDGGMEQIWKDHLTAGDPYLSVLLASDHSPYADAAIPNLPFARDPVVAAAAGYIARFQPALIVTGHPDERHVDHRTNNWIVVKAMQELLRKKAISAETRLSVDKVYGPLPGTHAPYHYQPEEFFVSGEAARLGQEALWFYQTQDGNHQQANITAFDKLPREEPYPHFRILDWQQHEGWNEKR